jgi:hypothetical protein
VTTYFKCDAVGAFRDRLQVQWVKLKQPLDTTAKCNFAPENRSPQTDGGFRNGSRLQTDLIARDKHMLSGF